MDSWIGPGEPLLVGLRSAERQFRRDLTFGLTADTEVVVFQQHFGAWCESTVEALPADLASRPSRAEPA